MDAFDCTEEFSRRPVWAQVDLDGAAYNMRSIRKHIGSGILIMSVVKANAYGHGAAELSRVFLENGANRLAVACLDEAVELRRAGITAPILVLGHTDGRRAPEAVLYNVDVTVFRYDDAALFAKEAARRRRNIRIHIAVDSGMGRIGYQPSERSVDEIERILALPHLVAEGIFTHFAVADDAAEDAVAYTEEQFRKFSRFCRRLSEEGIAFSLRHCCSSAGILAYPAYWCNMVRPGIIQYGYAPSDAAERLPFTPQPVMSLRCCITHIKRIPAGETISYGRRFTARRPTVVATLPLGYADGYPRALSNQSDVLVRGRRARQIGSICMDQCMIDVTDIPGVQVGDECVLFGRQGGESISLKEWTDKLGTIPHECLCNIGRRVPLVYVRGGRCAGRTEYIGGRCGEGYGRQQSFV